MRKTLVRAAVTSALTVVCVGVALGVVAVGSAAAGAHRVQVVAGAVAPAVGGGVVSVPRRGLGRHVPVLARGRVALGRDRHLGPLAWSAAGPFRDGHVLVRYRRGTSRRVERALERRAGALAARRLGLGVLLVVRPGAVSRVIRRLAGDRAVRYAEPDYVLQATGVPNDPSFALQWAAQNTGQSVNGTAGTANADEHAVPAWGVTTGSASIVVAVTDTGVEYTHPDLAANMWSNPGAVGGCATGTHGFNVLAGESACDPIDSETAYGGHGTHVAGIIGAVGNNSVGVSGVNWRTSMMAVKWLDSENSGLTSDLLNGLQKVIQAKQAGVNVRVVNDSSTFVGTAFSQALSDAIDQLGANNILFVTAAGNTAQNNDTTPRYPCAYDRPSEICVAASDQNDKLPSWANWGPTTVDLAAPGDNIYSTLRSASYGTISGSSMSAAEVSGAAALILAAGDQTVTQLKADILNNVDPLPSLNGLVRTGGRLDICKAIPGCTQTPPPTSTFGTTTVGANSDTAAANRKRVNSYVLSANATVTKLSIYLQPTSVNGTQVLEGVIYADSGGAPSSLIAVSNQLTFASTNAAGWYDLPFATPPHLAPGTYWIGCMSGTSAGVIGFRWDSVSASRAFNTNTFTSSPSNPFGAFSTDSEQISLYATYTTQTPPPPSPPVNSTPPAISGNAQAGQTLTASNGSWTGSPTQYSYQWQRCDTNGNNCVSTGGTSQTYVVANADVGNTLEVAVTATNTAGPTTAVSAHTATVQAQPPSPPVNSTPPAISGNAQAGQTLTASNGSWTGSPTQYSYQWQRCDTNGNNCVSTGGTSQTYVVANADVGNTLEVAVTASNTAGPTTAVSAHTATVQAQPPSPPVNSTPPAISGNAQAGQTLTASNGSWTGSPTQYSYQWQRCDTNGNNCVSTGGTSQTYVVANADVGNTLEVAVTASNTAGPTTAVSAHTATVQAAATSATFGTTTVGANSDTAAANRKRVNSYVLSANATVTKLSIYLQPTSVNGTQVLEGVIYADSGGAPSSLIAVSNQLTFASTNAAGWYDLPFATPPHLAPGTYWIGCMSGTSAGVIGFRWDSVSASRAFNTNTFTSSPSNPFGAFSTDSEQISLYATYTTQTPPPPSPPVNSTPPAISGNAQAGQTLTASNGSWTGSPTQYSYQWQRCDTNGNNCVSTGGTSQTYVVANADVGNTLEVAVTASNTAGPTTAVSAHTATVQAAATSATFGTTTVGANSDTAAANRKRVNSYVLSANATVTKLSIYLQPTSVNGTQVLEGVIYADSGGAPSSLIAVSNQLTFASTNAAGWYDLPFATPPHLAPGTYWIGCMSGTSAGVIGFRWDSVSASRAFNTNTFTSSPSNPFGAFSTDSEQISLYATYTLG